jgi:catechol 2,3-dioxygenase-like lactoylglutathione lyase family enzyme
MVLRNADVFASFSVDDVDAARQFFEETLGLEVQSNPMGFLELQVGDGRHVMVYPKQNHEPATFTVLNFLVSDLDAAVDRLTEAGVQMEQYDLPEMKTDARGIAREGGQSEGPGIAWFKDPAGNIHAVLEMP